MFFLASLSPRREITVVLRISKRRRFTVTSSKHVPEPAQLDLKIICTYFYKRKSSKPLLCRNAILSKHNLYKYHCLLEMFKVIKLHTLIPLYNLFQKSPQCDS